jgi:large subunit ribosomal protein L9
MEVILREDIEKLGSRGQVVKVADGYARNYLLPRRLAVAATEANKKIVEQERQAYLRREAKVLADAQELAKIMAPVSVTIKQKAGEQDQLFGSVTSKDIAEALEKAGYSVERRKIQLEAPIKQVGEFKVPIRLHRDVTVDITVTVASDEEEATAATPEAQAPKEEQK